jgi:hypothetical protein
VKALVIILAFLLVLAHPAAVAAVLAAEAAVVAGLGWLTWRGLRAAMLPPAWRRTA